MYGDCDEVFSCLLLILCSLRTSFVSLASLLSSSTWIHGHSSTQSCPSKLEGGRTCIMSTFNWDETLVCVIIMSRRSRGFSSQMLVSCSPNFVSRTFLCGDGPLGDLDHVVGTGVQYLSTVLDRGPIHTTLALAASDSNIRVCPSYFMPTKAYFSWT
jgi:hypothetical protein